MPQKGIKLYLYHRFVPEIFRLLSRFNFSSVELATISQRVTTFVWSFGSVEARVVITNGPGAKDVIDVSIVLNKVNPINNESVWFTAHLHSLSLCY